MSPARPTDAAVCGGGGGGDGGQDWLREGEMG